MYKYLLFDADNTLLDFNACEAQALKETLLEFPCEFTPEVLSLYHSINDNEWKRLERGETTRDLLRVERFEKLYFALGVDGKKYGEATADIYMARLSEQGIMMDGAENVLKALYKKYDCYIVTNGTASVQRSRLAKTTVPRYVKHIFISEDMGCMKPSPCFFEKVCDFVGDREKASYLVIGDSLTSDIAGAVNYGLDSVWLTKEAVAGPQTYKIDSISKLLQILD